MNFEKVRGRFVCGIPKRRARVVRPSLNDDWKFSLGMHNFRRALRIEGSKSRSVSSKIGDNCVGKRERRRLLRKIRRSKRVGVRSRSKRARSRRNKRKRLRKYLRRDKRRYYRLLTRWERSEFSAVNVKKSSKVVSAYDEECKALRKLPFKRTGQYWRFMNKMKIFNPIVNDSAEIVKSNRSVERKIRRRKWLLENSWLKLPAGFLKNTTMTFNKYCVQCQVLGHYTAFHLISHWISPEAKRVKKMFDKKKELYSIYNGEDLFREAAPGVPAEPNRGDYRNYKTWRSAYEHFHTLLVMAKEKRIVDRGVVVIFDDNILRKQKAKKSLDKF